MHRKFKADTDKENAAKEALLYINDILSQMKLSHKEHNRASLMCGESLLRLMDHYDFTRSDYISVRQRKSFGNVSIILYVPGEEFDFYAELEDNTCSSSAAIPGAEEYSRP